MRLGYHLGYWGAGPPRDALATVRACEDLGYDSVWTAEAYGSDAFTPLAWWGASTSRLVLGTNIVQMAARTPVATAMAAMTLDHLSGGRAALGIGVSGPQVVEGWYGQPYPKPLARTREYLQVLRAVMAREKVEHHGAFFDLPLQGGSGLGKPLRSTLHPLRPTVPVHLAAEGPKNVALAAELCDGWLPLFFSPKADASYREALAEGFDRRGAHSTPEDFEVSASVAVVIADTVDAAADRVRPQLALYVGGMGARRQNFHLDVFVRLGYEEVCREVQERYLAGDRDGAAAAIPLEMVTDIALVGPPHAVREQARAWEDTCVTRLLVQAVPLADDPVAGLRAVADALL